MQAEKFNECSVYSLLAANHAKSLTFESYQEFSALDRKCIQTAGGICKFLTIHTDFIVLTGQSTKQINFRSLIFLREMKKKIAADSVHELLDGYEKR